MQTHPPKPTTAVIELVTQARKSMERFYSDDNYVNLVRLEIDKFRETIPLNICHEATEHFNSRMWHGDYEKFGNGAGGLNKELALEKIDAATTALIDLIEMGVGSPKLKSAVIVLLQKESEIQLELEKLLEAA